MKQFSFIFLFLLFSCKAQEIKKQIKQACPKEGTCAVEISKNNILQIKEDTTKALYPTLKKGNNIVFKFEYKKKTIKNRKDGHYSEVIYLEFDPSKKHLSLKDLDLQKSKLLFGRFCYCKGSAGWFKIENGNLKIDEISKNKFRIQLTFKNFKTPQILQAIDETVFTNF